MWTIYHTHTGTSSTVTDGLQKNTAPKIIIVVCIWAYAVSYCNFVFLNDTGEPRGIDIEDCVSENNNHNKSLIF